jgi:glycosyltransferase involved in cell wall biosynthesis
MEKDSADNRIRICMVSLSFYPTFSGAGIQAWRLCRKLVKKGVRLTVIAGRTDKSAEDEAIGEIKVHRLQLWRQGRWAALLFAVRLFCSLVNHRRQYDLIHVHGAYWYSQVVVMVGKLLRKRSIVKMTMLGDDDPISIRKRQLFGGLGLRILGMADRIVSTSRELTDSYRLSKLRPERLVEIPNGVDTEHFSPVPGGEKQKIRKHLGLPPDEAIVTFAGEICHRKGIDILIKAWDEVNRELPRARLLLVGPNNDNLEETYVRDIHRQIEELKLTDKIIFTGRVDNLNQYLQASDVFAFPSRREGMPNAVLEAMACGLPCAAMETSCVSGIITGGKNGLIFDSENSRQLAQHLLRLLKDPAYARQLGEEARKTMVTDFSLDSVAGRYLELYQELLK